MIASDDTPEVEPRGLVRQLGFGATTAIVVGTIIGSGIFRSPAGVAAEVGSVGAVATVWIVGGVVTLCGALTLAELAAALPESGGLFVYLREAFGPVIAFVYGWTMLFVAPASGGAVALVFGEYLGKLIPLSEGGTHAAAAALCIACGVAGYRTVRGAGVIQSVSSLAKVLALAGLVCVAFLFGDGNAGAFSQHPAVPAAGVHGSGTWGIGLALVSALWAYNGFQDMVTIAGEVRDPGNTLPRALITGTATVVAVNLAANAAYLWVLPFTTLQQSPLVASDVAVRAVGPAGARIVAAMVMISTLGAVNGLTLAYPRLSYAMAHDRLLFTSLGRVHPRFSTPYVAILAFVLLELLFVYSRSFEQLAEVAILGQWPFIALAAVGVLVLRRTRPHLARPYRTPWYPVVPLIFIAGTLWMVGSALIADTRPTLLGLGFALLGVPIYWTWLRVQRRPSRGPATSQAP